MAEIWYREIFLAVFLLGKCARWWNQYCSNFYEPAKTSLKRYNQSSEIVLVEKWSERIYLTMFKYYCNLFRSQLVEDLLKIASVTINIRSDSIVELSGAVKVNGMTSLTCIIHGTLAPKKHQFIVVLGILTCDSLLTAWWYKFQTKQSRKKELHNVWGNFINNVLYKLILL